MADARLLFDSFRAYKRQVTGHPLDGLDQTDVDDLNAVLHKSEARWRGKPPQVVPQGQGAANTSGRVSVGIENAPLAGGVLQPSPACFAMIKGFEGYHRKLGDGRVQAYPDPASGGDPWTIGYGSTGPDVKQGTIWTQEQAEARLEADVRKFARGVDRLIAGAPTTQNELDAMTSLAFNIGLGNFEKSTLLKKHKAGDKAGAAAEFTRWNRAAGKVMPGLTRRREAEAKLYRGER